MIAPNEIPLFADFAETGGPLPGDKLGLDEILNRALVIVGFRHRPSKHPKPGCEECLTIQFFFADDPDQTSKVVFTGSGVLADAARRYADRLPFRAAIAKVARYYSFV